MPEARLQRTRANCDSLDLEVYRAEVRLMTMRNFDTMSVEEGSKRLADWIDARAARDVYAKMKLMK